VNIPASIPATAMLESDDEPRSLPSLESASNDALLDDSDSLPEGDADTASPEHTA
jgi:hypothetical protein